MANGKKELTKENFSNIFLVVVIIFSLWMCYLLFRPFLHEIIIAGILVTIFYPVYLKILYWTRGSLALSSLLVCLLIFLIIVIPFSLFLYYLANEAIALYASLASNGTGNAINQFFNSQFWQEINVRANDLVDVQKFLMDSVTYARSYVITGATALISGVTNFVISLVIVFFTMFFMFIEGRTLLRRLMQLTPLSNRYDKLIWMKFRDVSYTTIVASFITALAQATVGVIGFLIVGLSPLMAGVLIFMFSFLPYVGTVAVWLPAAIYLFVIGKVGAAIFMLLWGMLVISLIDNFIRPVLIKGKAKVHPMIIFFSIFGGLTMFGIWGVVFGPLIIALAFTVLHIYELQYSDVLENK